jgi:NitT/TauT family transport system ATP-binding protein
MISSILSFNNLSKAYKTKKVVRQIFENISMNVLEGERIGVVGANGSGKSTFLKLLMKQEKPDVGDVLLSVTNDKISYLPQDYRNALFPWLTVSDNFSLLLDGQSNSKYRLSLPEELKLKIETLFEKLEVKVPFNKYPYQLSGGEQQVLLLVQSIIRQPNLLIADEAFSAIDFHKKEIVLNHFAQWIQERNVTSIMVSHDIEEAVYLSDRIIILSKNSCQFSDDFKINIPFPREPKLRFEKIFQDITQHIKSNFE